MGFRVSYFACQDMEPSEVCARLELAQTHVNAEPFESPFSIAVLPTGWTVLALNDELYVDEERLVALSKGGRTVLACQVVDTTNYAASACHVDAEQQWMVIHNSLEAATTDLQIFRTPPPEFAAVRDRLTAQQKAQPPGDDAVDYVADIPVELVYQLCGFRHDRWKFDWGEPVFTEVTATKP